jgi:hypothetical protein
MIRHDSDFVDSINEVALTTGAGASSSIQSGAG